MSTEEMNTEIPEDFEYNESDLERPRDQYVETGKDSIFKGVIAKCLRSVGTNKKEPSKSSNNLQLEVVLRALNAQDQKTGPEARTWVTIPVPNPKVPGHKPFTNGKARDMQFLRARELIRAVEGDDALPAFPKKREGSDQYFDPSTGENLSPMERKALVKQIDDLTVQKLREYYRDPAKLESAVVYFGTKKKDKSEFTNVQYLRHDDGGRSVITENFTG